MKIHRRRLAVILLCVGCAGCASAPQDLVALTPATTFRATGQALGPFQVRLDTDRRPPQEHGTRKYPGRSYLGYNDLVEPTAVSLLRILARDLRASGVASIAGLERRDDGYVLEVHVVHLGASYNDGIETLVPVLPTSAIAARVAIRLRVRDRVGRLFLDATYTAERNTVAALLTGIQSTAAATLAESLRAVCDQALPEIHRSVPAFWKRIGRRAPAPGP